MTQDVWTFRIVDQDTGAPVSGVPVTLLDDGGAAVSYLVSDADGLVRLPRHDRPRLRLRIGLRSEEPIELDTRTLTADPIPVTAPRRAQPVRPAHVVPVDPALAPPTQSRGQAAAPANVLRFAQIGAFPAVPAAPGPGANGPVDPTEFSAPDYPAPIRYGVLFEVEQLWQPTGTESGDLLYSVSLAPGDEVRAVVLDGRWRRHPQRERPLQIVARMIGTSSLGGGLDAVPLEPFLLHDLAGAAAETVGVLAERTVRVCANLRLRPLGVMEVQGDPPEESAIRTVRNARTDAVVTYHFVEPLERYRVIVRTPRVHPAILVPFRLPDLATREVVRQFGHALQRGILDRSHLPDLEAVMGRDRPPPGAAERLFAHVTANLSYYSATIIAAEPAARQLALAKLRDPAGRVLTDVIENRVVGRVGNYVAFPLRAAEFVPEAWRPTLAGDPARLHRLSEELSVLLPIPGVWIKAELTQSLELGGRAGEKEEEEGRDWRTRRRRG